jgi:hypothetical protein
VAFNLHDLTERFDQAAVRGSRRCENVSRQLRVLESDRRRNQFNVRANILAERRRDLRGVLPLPLLDDSRSVLIAAHPFTALVCTADRRQRLGHLCRTPSVQRWQHQDRTDQCD